MYKTNCYGACFDNLYITNVDYNIVCVSFLQKTFGDFVTKNQIMIRIPLKEDELEYV